MLYCNLLTLLLLSSINLLAQESTPVEPETEKVIEKDLDNAGVVDEKIVFKSIMHNSEEMQKINKAFQMFKQGEEYIIEDEKNEENSDNEDQFSEESKIIEEKSRIYLGSILYFSKNNWSVWINDKIISSDNNKPSKEIFIRDLNGKKANIIWSLSPSKWQILMGKSLEENDSRVNKNNLIIVKFTLQNNQSFLLKENKVIEGRPASKSKEKSSPTN